MAIDKTPGPANYDASEMNDAVRQLNSLLRGELAAAETYRMAIDQITDKQQTSQDLSLLQELRTDHERAALSLRERIRQLGGEPSESAGAWVAWSKTLQATANLFGDAAALKELKEGEKDGLKDYRDLLGELDPSTAGVIRTTLIPAQERHIDLLDQLIHKASQA